MKNALDCGNITPEAISQIMDMRDRKRRVQVIHPYKVTQLPDGRWQTYFKEKGMRSRKLVRTNTEDELYEQLYNLYTDRMFLDNMTLDALYHEWIEYKANITESPNTIRRHKQHYAKYFEKTMIFGKKVSDITSIVLNQFCNELVKENQMSRKEWTNVKTILKGMFELAEEKEYINDNPMHRLRITVKFRQVNKKLGDTETFNTDEVQSLYDYLDERYDKSHDIALMAVKLNTMIGLRVGELVALKWSDIIDGQHIHVSREEIRNQDTKEREVVSHTKTRQDRFVVIIPQAAAILDELYRYTGTSDGFIFIRNGERLTTRQVNYVLEKYAERTHSLKKSSHKLRKTYASVLQSNGVPIDEIRRQLGHASIQTTLSYIFNPLTNKETFDKIAGAFAQNLNTN